MTLTLRLDASALIACLDEATVLLAQADVLEAPEAALEAADRLLGTSDLAQELVALQVDDLTAGAGELVVRLEPSDRLRGLVAALGARDGN